MKKNLDDVHKAEQSHGAPREVQNNKESEITTMSTQATDPQKVTVYGRLSYANLFKPRSVKDNPGKLRYSVNVLIDPRTERGKADIQKIRKAIEAAMLAQWKKSPYRKMVDENFKPLDPKRYCLVDGSTFTDDDGNVRPECKGMMVFKAACPASDERPAPILVDIDGRSPLKATDGKLYSGSYGRVGVRIYGTDQGGSPGVFAALNAAQFKEHGEPLGGGAARAEDYFEAETIEDSDDL